jgi:hypothetical protein
LNGKIKLGGIAMGKVFCYTGPREAYGFPAFSLPLFDGEVVVRVASYYVGRKVYNGWAVGYNLTSGEVMEDDPVEVFFHGNSNAEFNSAYKAAVDAAKVTVLRAHCDW